MFLVTGITGNVGGAAARGLLVQGKQVRALVRDIQKAAAWADQGVELVRGDWNDTASISEALKDVEGAYIMMPPTQTPSPAGRTPPERGRAPPRDIPILRTIAFAANHWGVSKTS